jgi:hypothetical protein
MSGQREVDARKVKAVALEVLMQKPNTCGARIGIHDRIPDEIEVLEKARYNSFMGESENTSVIADWMWMSGNSESLYESR